MTKTAEKRLNPKVRKETIIIAAFRVARKPGGWSRMTRAAIAKEAHCAEGLISKYLGSMDSVRRIIMKRAIKNEYMELIAQGIASGEPAAMALSPVLKHKAISSFLDLGE